MSPLWNVVGIGSARRPTLAHSVVCLSLLGAVCQSVVQAAGPAVDLVIGPESSQLERFAAEELASHLHTLFAAETQIRTDGKWEQNTTDRNSILIGNPTSNPAIRAVLGTNWPKLSANGHFLRSVAGNGKPVLVVGGNTSQSTLGAAYELAHRYGLRSLLQGDFPAVEPKPFTLDGFNLVLEPNVETRAWQLLDGGPLGWEAWGLADYRRLLRQLRKLQFNQVNVIIGPSQPFLHFEVAGRAKTSGDLFSGQQFSVAGDTAGRKAFQGKLQFQNPDFAGCKTYADRSKAGVALVRALVDSAHELGLRVAVQLSPLEFPREIAEVLRAAEPGKVLDASVAQLNACLETYPRIDALYLAIPADSPIAVEKIHIAWQEAIAKNTVRRTSPTPLEIKFLAGPSQGSVPIDLFHASAGVLPACVLGSLQELVEEARKPGRGGWNIRARIPSDAELGTYFLSRNAWERRVSPAQASDELITTIAGEGIAPRLLKGFEMVEKAAQLFDRHGPGFAAPDPKMVLQHQQESEPPMWWSQSQALYTDAMNEMYRGNSRARSGGRSFILYYARRCEFGLTYMASLQALRKSEFAKSQGDSEGQRMQLETAVESLYNALGAFGEVARDPSDRGVIAVLNEFGYRPLRQQLAAVED